MRLIIFSLLGFALLKANCLKKKYSTWLGYNSATVVKLKDLAKSIFLQNFNMFTLTIIIGCQKTKKITRQCLLVLAIMIISWYPIKIFIYLLNKCRDFKSCLSTLSVLKKNIKISLCCFHQDTDTDDNCLLWMKNLFTNHE